MRVVYPIYSAENSIDARQHHWQTLHIIFISQFGATNGNTNDDDGDDDDGGVFSSHKRNWTANSAAIRNGIYVFVRVQAEMLCLLSSG